MTASGRGLDQDRGQDMDGLAALAGLPGLETVQEQLAGWIAVIWAELARREAGMAVERPAWKNLVFTGGPGAGKSRAARALARTYQELGLLTLGHVVEVTAADLMGAKLQETGMLTREAFNRAGGGILLINGTHAWRGMPDRGQQMLRCLSPLTPMAVPWSLGTPGRQGRATPGAGSGFPSPPVASLSAGSCPGMARHDSVAGDLAH